MLSGLDSAAVEFKQALNALERYVETGVPAAL